MFQSTFLRVALVYIMATCFSMWLDMRLHIQQSSLLDWAIFLVLLLVLLWVFVFTWEEKKEEKKEK